MLQAFRVVHTGITKIGKMIRDYKIDDKEYLMGIMLDIADNLVDFGKVRVRFRHIVGDLFEVEPKLPLLRRRLLDLGWRWRGHLCFADDC